MNIHVLQQIAVIALLWGAFCLLASILVDILELNPDTRDLALEFIPAPHTQRKWLIIRRVLVALGPVTIASVAIIWLLVIGTAAKELAIAWILNEDRVR